MGRPPDENEARSVAVILRVLPEERERWKAAAKAAGFSGVSAWIRHLANKAATRAKERKQ